MELAETQWSALKGLAATGSDATRGIDACVQIAATGIIAFRYVLRGEISRLRVPPAKSIARADELWKHTCFEAFIRAPGAAAYYELNFAPSGQWAMYRFDAYRAGMSSAPLDPPPALAVRPLDNRLEVDASVRLIDLTGVRGARRLEIGLSAVVEDENGTLSYWALAHAAAKPDFHDPGGFLIRLTV
jgi:hypothetical protein